jgi:hypothetical protein
MTTRPELRSACCAGHALRREPRSFVQDRNRAVAPPRGSRDAILKRSPRRHRRALPAKTSSPLNVDGRAAPSCAQQLPGTAMSVSITRMADDGWPSWAAAGTAWAPAAQDRLRVEVVDSQRAEASTHEPRDHTSQDLRQVRGRPVPDPAQRGPLRAGLPVTPPTAALGDQ